MTFSNPPTALKYVKFHTFFIFLFLKASLSLIFIIIDIDMEQHFATSVAQKDTKQTSALHTLFKI